MDWVKNKNLDQWLCIKTHMHVTISTPSTWRQNTSDVIVDVDNMCLEETSKGDFKYVIWDFMMSWKDKTEKIQSFLDSVPRNGFNYR